MKEPERPPRKRYCYPTAYEKLIPVALGIIAVAALVSILFALTVALGLLPSVIP